MTCMKACILGLAVALTLPFGAAELSLAQSLEETSEAWGVPGNGLQMTGWAITDAAHE